MLFALSLWLIGCGSVSAEDVSACELPAEWPAAYVLESIDLVDTRSGTVHKDQWIAVSNDRIQATSRTDERSEWNELEALDGCGLTVAPGLADMHVHLNPEDLPAYVSAGVTTVRNLWGWPGLKTLIQQVDTKQIEGPTIHGISPGLDGPPEYWPFTQLVMTPEQGRASVRKQVADGWTTLKLYQDLSHDTYLAIVDEAQKNGMAYGGHISRKVGLRLALASGHGFIEHLSGYEVELNPMGQGGAIAWRSIDESLIPELIEMTVASGVWNCPTLAIFSLIARGDAVVSSRRQAFVKALFDAQAPLLIGTDAGIGRTAPGTSIHDEIQEFVEAGISTRDVLRIATIEAARFLNAEGEFGELVSDSQADFLLIEGDPFPDLSVLRSPEAVILKGKRVR